MSDRKPLRIRRREFFRSACVLAGATALANVPREVEAHDLRPGEPIYQFDKYESIVNRRVRIRQLYAWSNVTNAIIYPNISNGLNGFHFSYGIPPDQIQVVVQAYASANLPMYDDHIWEKYKLGEASGIKDPDTGAPATRNLWYRSKIPAQTGAQPPSDRTNPYYSDTSIEGLQRRGVLFLI